MLLWEKGVKITWMPEIAAVGFCYVGDPKQEEFYDTNYKLWELFKGKASSRLLMDVRYQAPLFEGSSEWIHQTWYPTMIQNGMRKEAVLVSPEMMAYVPPDKQYTVHEEHKDLGGVLEIKYFVDVDAATAWLAEKTLDEKEQEAKWEKA